MPKTTSISSKLHFLVDQGELVLRDVGDELDRPTGLENLEETFLLRGPPLFGWLCSRYERRKDVEAAAGVSHATLSRWMNTEVGQAFGQGRSKDISAHQSIWWGYPMPFPGFDRICEEIYGFDDSFLSVCIKDYGLHHTQKWLTSEGGFGLEMLRADPADILTAAGEVQIQSRLARRWMCGRRYPSQWAAMDRVCDDVLGCSWLEAVLLVQVPSLPREVPVMALRFMGLSVLEPGL